MLWLSEVSKHSLFHFWFILECSKQFTIQDYGRSKSSVFKIDVRLEIYSKGERHASDH